MPRKAESSEVRDAAAADIELFDLDSTIKPRTWSPNPAKTRLALNFKQIKHRVSHLSYPDLHPVLSAKGFAPNAAGRAYTSPAISHNGTHLMDSFPIALYLDEKFPDHPLLFPKGTGALTIALFVQRFMGNDVAPLSMQILLPIVPGMLDPRGAEYFTRTRSESLGKPLAEKWTPEEQAAAWEKLSERMKEITAILEQTTEGPFFLGDVPSYGDLILVAGLHWYKIAGPEAFDRLMSLGSPGVLRKLYEACEGWFGGVSDQ